MQKRFNASAVGAGLLLAAFAALAAFPVVQFAYREITALQRQDELSEIEAGIRLGQDQGELRSLLRDKLGHAPQELEEVDTDLWLISNPLRFGATNWVLVLAFREGRLIGKGFRTEDSLEASPDGAPPDVTEESFTAEWQSEYGPY